jgi:hypothetical protein
MKLPVHECVIIRVFADVAWALAAGLALFGHRVSFLREIGNFAEGVVFLCTAGIVLWVWSWISAWRAVRDNHPLRHQTTFLLMALVLEFVAIPILVLSSFRF